MVGSLLAWRLLFSTPAGHAAPVQTVALTLSSTTLTNVRGTGQVVFIEFGDYECPFCRKYAMLTEPAVATTLVSSGSMTEAYMNFPLSVHPHAQKASEAAECAADQNRFWEMHQILFEHSRTLDLDALVKSAEHLGLDTSSFNTCLETGSAAARVRAQIAVGQRLGVVGTPAFFVGTRDPDGTIHLSTRIDGALPFDRVQQIVATAYRRKEAPLWNRVFSLLERP